ncbi:hypothetical protein STEG23_020131 [Scotinomys teguina]
MCVNMGSPVVGLFVEVMETSGRKGLDGDEGLQIVKQGTSDTDTVCACKEGQHCTSKECKRCALHTSCGPGFGVKQMATGTTDTVCEPCPAGFFSNESSTFEKCHPWTSCEDKKMSVLQEGTNQTDTVCGLQPRIRALLVVPIVMVILITISVSVFFCIKKVVKEPEDKKHGDTGISGECLGLVTYRQEEEVQKGEVTHPRTHSPEEQRMFFARIYRGHRLGRRLRWRITFQDEQLCATYCGLSQHHPQHPQQANPKHMTSAPVFCPLPCSGRSSRS